MKDYDELFEKLNNKNPQVFVNNAAVFSKENLGIQGIPHQTLKNQIVGNCFATTILCDNFLK